MHVLLARACVLFALGALVGCTAMPTQDSSHVASGVSATGTTREASQSRLEWHLEAQELRTFADRHEVEAEMLLQHPLPTDTRLIQQRRALARQLRVAAEQIEQRAEEMP